MNISFIKTSTDFNNKHISTLKVDELCAEKLHLHAVSESVCDHSWVNTGISLQGKRLMICSKCKETKQAIY